MGLRTIICDMFHRKNWFFYGYGDWRIQKCGKCGDTWVVPFYHAKGPRKDQPNDQ